MKINVLVRLSGNINILKTIVAHAVMQLYMYITRTTVYLPDHDHA